MPGAWDDYDVFSRSVLPKLTMYKLKQVAESMSRQANINLNIRSQDKKADLVDKVQRGFNTLRQRQNVNVYVTLRKEVEDLRESRFMPALGQIPQPTFGGVPSVTSGSNNYAGGSRVPAASSAYARPAGLSGWQQSTASSSSNNLLNRSRPGGERIYPLVDWKPSPMWKPVKALSNMEMLPDIGSNESSHTRRDKRINFILGNDVIDLLNKSKADPHSRPQYQVRMFCASSDHYRPPSMAQAHNAAPITNRAVPIEFPNNPDAMLDDHMVPFKERGLRGKAGSAPPLDLDRGSRGLIRMAGRMASLSVGHTGSTLNKKKEAKKFWFQIVFMEWTSMDDLLKRLESLQPTDAEVELQKLRQKAAEDDDIEVGTATLSLKDPLSGMRIAKPVRSSRCSHLQCFDARWWLESNKSHPQWQCPHCSKELKFDDIICDGYFLSILNAVNDNYDEVTLEASGDWHSADNLYGTADWLAANGATPAAAAPIQIKIAVKRSRSEEEQPSPDKGKRRAIEILSDSDDEDEPLSATNGRANGYSNGGANGGHQTGSLSRTASVQPPASSNVIDLTLSSDEEEDEPPRRPHFRPVGSGFSGSHRPSNIPATESPSSQHSSVNPMWGAPPAGPARHNPVPITTTTQHSNLSMSRQRASDWLDEYIDTPLEQHNGVNGHSIP